MSPEDAKKEIYDYVQGQITSAVLDLRKKGILCEWGGKIVFELTEDDIARYIKIRDEETARKVGLFQRFFNIF